MEAVAKRHGVKYALSTDSGSGAIHSAVGAYDFEPGDEIITTPVTDIGTVQGILLQNLIPVFADWDANTLNTEPADIERKITDRTRAILVVHLFGNPCDMDEIMEVARRHDLPVIEDCPQAHLAEYKGRTVGTIGDLGCFSMGGKLLSLGSGGMIITDNEQLARRAKGHSRKGSEYDDAAAHFAQAHVRRGRHRERIRLPRRFPPDERPDGCSRSSTAPALGRI